VTRRVSKTVSGEVRHGYFTTQWQLIEERTGSSTTAERQFVWGTRYLDDLILRDKSSERLYALHDQWHVTGVVDPTGAAQERYIYSAFGVSTVLTGSFASRAGSSFGWETRYGAYRFDAETALYCVRYRYLHPALGRWVSRDPIEEAGGLNLLNYVSNSPVNLVDSHGLEYTLKGLNCLGYAAGVNVGLYPSPGESLKTLLEKRGWTCNSSQGSSKCKCDCGKEDVMMVYVYIRAPYDPSITTRWTESDWRDWYSKLRKEAPANACQSGWIHSNNLKFDFHAIRRNCPEKEGSSKTWAYVPRDFEVSEKVTVKYISEADSYWRNGGKSLLDAMCCRKKKSK
jgi:RHS repeat-associated protein